MAMALANEEGEKAIIIVMDGSRLSTCFFLNQATFHSNQGTRLTS